MDHISLSRWADVVLFAPATANKIAQLSNGLAQDLATTVALASDKDIFIAPAMNVRMWENSITKSNLKNLLILIIKLLDQTLVKWLVENMDLESFLILLKFLV